MSRKLIAAVVAVAGAAAVVAGAGPADARVVQRGYYLGQESCEIARAEFGRTITEQGLRVEILTDCFYVALSDHGQLWTYQVVYLDQ